MKRTLRAKLRNTLTVLTSLTIAALNIQLSTAWAQGTAFSYQGELNANGAPANGTNYSMVFYVYNTATGGTSLGNVGIASVTVSNGLFSVPLDFGNIFDGTPRWLEVSLEKTGVGGDSGFTTLAPRQQILSTPYSIQSLSASNLLGSIAPAQINGQILTTQLPGVVVTNNQGGVILTGTFTGNGAGLTNLSASALPANVALLNANQTFSGSNTFTHPVVVSGAAPVLKMAGLGGAGAHATIDLSTYDPGTNAPSARIQTTDNNWGSDWDFLGKVPGANTNPLVSFVHIAASGNVGIGTTNPAAALHVVSPAGLPVLFDSSSPFGTYVALRNTYPGGTNWEMLVPPDGALLFLVASSIGSNGVGSAPLILTPTNDVFVGRYLRFGDSQYAPRGIEPLRIIRGVVAGNGSVLSGAGFGVAHTPGTGSYAITFSTPFGANPTVTATAVDVLARAGGSLSPSAVTIGTVDFAGNAQDDGFQFIAVGPP